jgi:hypothetical protein
MSARLYALADTYIRARDPRAIASNCLGRMQQVLAEDLEGGKVQFADPDWVASLAEALHGRWIDACQQFDQDPSSLRTPYRDVFRAVVQQPCTVLEALVFPLTVHIVHDLTLALVEVEFRSAPTRLADFDVINGRLAAEIDAIEHLIHRSYDPTSIPIIQVLDQLGGTADRILTDIGFRVSRAWAWYQACRLVDPRHSADARREIEHNPIELMRLVRTPHVWEPLAQVYRLTRFVAARLPFSWPPPTLERQTVSRAAPPHPAGRQAPRLLQPVPARRKSFVDHWPYLVGQFRAEGMATYSFLVEGQIERMRDYLRRFFVEPSGGQVDLEPASPLIVVEVTTTQHMGGSGGTFPDIGGQTEMAVVFFATDRRHADALVAVSPYIVVDNPISAIQAREVFGLPKEVGRFEPPLDGPDPTDLVVNVMGVADLNAAGARFETQPFVRVQRVSDAEPSAAQVVADVAHALSHPVESVEALAGALGDVIGEGDLALKALPGLLEGRLRVLSLKQFKDVSSSAVACYQSIVANDMRITSRGGMRHLDGQYQLTFHHLDTHPIGKELGLEGTRPARLSFWMSYDLDLTGSEWA